MDNLFPRIGFLGAGSTATVLALGLAKAGYVVVGIASRTLTSARSLAAKLPRCKAIADPIELLQSCDVVFLTVPDDVIASVAAALPWRKGQGVVHCSGALALDVLAPAAAQNALIGGIHPLQTFVTRDYDAQYLTGSTFAIDGEGALRHWLEEVVRHLRGHAIHLPSQDRPIYHAAAVMASGYVATLLDAAGTLWEIMGFSREEALRALLPLAQGTLDNLEALGIREGATGPTLRGDVRTIGRHLAALEDKTPEALALYCQMGLAMVGLALKQRAIEPHQANQIRDLLNTYLIPVMR